jgi:hypothetical protein
MNVEAHVYIPLCNYWHMSATVTSDVGLDDERKLELLTLLMAIYSQLKRNPKDGYRKAFDHVDVDTDIASRMKVGY